MRLGLFAVATMFAIGCGDGGGNNPDAAPGSDAAGPAAVGATDSSGQSIASVDVGSAHLGQSATTSIHITNTGGTTTSALALSITGTNVAEFTFDSSLTTCAAAMLAPGDSCTVAIVFTPTATGLQSATLTVDAGGGTILTLPLTGSGVGPLSFSPDTIDFGPSRTETIVTHTTTLTNTGTDQLSIALATTGPDFSIYGTSCGATLLGGESCDVLVEVDPTAVGDLAGMLTATSGSDVASVALTAHGVRPINVTLAGSGQGTVTSAPAGISCGTSCSGQFDTDVMLTAAPVSSSSFMGWTGASGCGTATTCSIPAGADPVNVTATFEQNALDVSFAGDSTGSVEVDDGATVLATCTAACTVQITPGHTISVAATSTAGISLAGACTASGGQTSCSFVAPAGTSSLLATFSSDPHVLWTQTLTYPAWAVVHDGSGNIIVASGNGPLGSATVGELDKLSSTGASVWTKPILASAIATGPSDSIYVLSGNHLMKLDSSGTTLWTANTDANSTTQCIKSDELTAKCVAVASDGSVVVYGNVGLTRWDSGGTQQWSMSLSAYASALLTGVAIDAAGVIYAMAEPNAVYSALRFDSGGNPLTTWSNVVNDPSSTIAIDADGGLAGAGSYGGQVIFTRTKNDGTADFSKSAMPGGGVARPSSVATSSAGNIAWWYLDAENPTVSGMGGNYHLSVFTDANAAVWTTQGSFGTASSLITGGYPLDMSYHGTQLVLAGGYSSDGITVVGWVQATSP